MPTLDEFEKKLKTPRNFPPFRVGDTVRVMVKVKEGDKERVQSFEGVVICNKKAGIRSTFTLRKISYGVGVERVFPYFSPVISAIEVKTRGDVRKSRIYYLRELTGKAARIRERDSGPADVVSIEEPRAPMASSAPSESSDVDPREAKQAQA